jgi:uncharacterized protein (TIGR02246 family)
MISSKWRVPALAAMILVGALVPVPAPAQTSGLAAADSKAIAAVNDAFGTAALAKNWKAVAALYAIDGVLYPPGESAVKGRPAIEACLTAFPPVTAFALRTTKIEGRDDLAYVQGTFTMTPVASGGETPAQQSGYFIQVLRRQANGTWQIAVHMLSLH